MLKGPQLHHLAPRHHQSAAPGQQLLVLNSLCLIDAAESLWGLEAHGITTKGEGRRMLAAR